MTPLHSSICACNHCTIARAGQRGLGWPWQRFAPNGTWHLVVGHDSAGTWSECGKAIYELAGAGGYGARRDDPPDGERCRRCERWRQANAGPGPVSEGA